MVIVLLLFFFNIHQETGSTATVAIVKVAVNEQWTDTGMTINAGQKLWFAVSPEAQIQCSELSLTAAGADDPVSNRSIVLPDARLCSLIGKVGETGKAFAIGLPEKPFTADKEGRVFLGINTDEFSKNSGEWTVLISKTPIQKKLIVVPAVEQWTSTGIEIESGSRVAFLIAPGSSINCDRRPTHATAEGAIPFEPELGRPVPSFSACGLIGKIDNRQPFKIGLNPAPFQMKDSGTLYLGINDTTLADNSGAFRVFVVVFSDVARHQAGAHLLGGGLSCSITLQRL